MIADALLPLLPGRVTQLQHRLAQPGVSRRQIRGAVLTLIRQGRARYFRGRVVALTTETTMNQMQSQMMQDDTDQRIAFETAPHEEIVSPATATVDIAAALDAPSPASALMLLVDAGTVEYEQASDAYYERFQPKHRRPLQDVARDEAAWGGRGYPGRHA
jgi:hypothetical protein